MSRVIHDGVITEEELMNIEDITPEIGNILLIYFHEERDVLDIPDYVSLIPGFTGKTFQEVRSDMDKWIEENLVVECEKDSVFAEGYRLTDKGRAYLKENQ